MKKILKSNSGSALALVLMVMTVVAVLATALYAYSAMSRRNYMRDVNRVQANLLAESGIETAASGWRSMTCDTSKVYRTEKMYLVKESAEGFESGFRMEDPLNPFTPNDYVGYYVVTVDPDSEREVDGVIQKVVEFVSVAYVGDETAAITAFIPVNRDDYLPSEETATEGDSESMVSSNPKTYGVLIWEY